MSANLSFSKLSTSWIGSSRDIMLMTARKSKFSYAILVQRSVQSLLPLLAILEDLEAIIGNFTFLHILDNVAKGKYVKLYQYTFVMPGM